MATTTPTRIGDRALLTAKKERHLAYTIRAGREAQQRLSEGHNSEALTDAAIAGLRAREQFIEANMRLVFKLASRRPTRPDLSVEDHISNGTIGLIRAVDKFDPDRGLKFSTMATRWILKAINEGVARTSVKVGSVEMTSYLANIRAGRFTADSGIGSPVDRQVEAISLAVHPASLDQRRDIGDTERPSLHDTLAAPDSMLSLDRTLDNLSLMALLDQCEPLDKLLVVLHFGIDRGWPRTYPEVAEQVQELAGRTLDASQCRNRLRTIMRHLSQQAHMLAA